MNDSKICTAMLLTWIQIGRALPLLMCTQICHAGDPFDNWTLHNLLPTGELLSGITYANGQFVTVGVAGSILTSADGGTWAIRKIADDIGLQAVGYGHGLLVAVGNGGTVLSSADGVTWVQRPSGTTNELRGISFGNGLFVAGR